METGEDDFRIEVADASDGPSVKAFGDLDLMTIDALVGGASALIQQRTASDSPTTLTIDLAGVNFCDSAGINGLVSLRNSCDAIGWKFRVANLRDHVHFVIVELTGLGDFLNVQRDNPAG